jgi:hypothetical protein
MGADSAVSADEVAAMAGLDEREALAMLTSGPNAQPYRVDQAGKPWFDIDSAGYALGFGPGQWSARVADFHIKRIAGGVSC